MRKATWGVLLLGVFALSVGWPIRDVPVLHRTLGLSLLVGYILLSLDPPSPSPRQRHLMLAGVGTAFLSFFLAFGDLPESVDFLPRALAVATVALPLWLVAGHARYAFVVAAAFALATAIPAIGEAGAAATSVHAYVAAAGAFWVAAALHRPALLRVGERKPPRLVVASNIVTLTPDQKKAALARIERQFQAGEIPEHVYWDRRQELESR